MELVDRLIKTYKGKSLKRFFKDLGSEIDADQKRTATHERKRQFLEIRFHEVSFMGHFNCRRSLFGILPTQYFSILC
jgi:hypothetical protein